MTQYRLKKDTFEIPAGTIATRQPDKNYEFEYMGNWVTLPAYTIENGNEFEKVEEPKPKPEWEKRLQNMSDNYSMEIRMVASAGKYNGHRIMYDFIRKEFTNMGEEILELSNNQTNRAFCDDVMQVMRERGAIK